MKRSDRTVRKIEKNAEKIEKKYKSGKNILKNRENFKIEKNYQEKMHSSNVKNLTHTVKYFDTMSHGKV